MYAKGLITGLMIAISGMIGVLHSPGISGEDEKARLAQFYESCIVKKIEKCESQAEMLYTSRSVTLQKFAELNAQKAQFFDSEREMLVNKMIQRRLEPKKYKIEHFLENQFYRSLAK
ncbi:MAG: hypothetical protein PVH74_12300 [Desulfobacterales bacterium]|jgi:hypothetical protein